MKQVHKRLIIKNLKNEKNDNNYRNSTCSPDCRQWMSPVQQKANEELCGNAYEHEPEFQAQQVDVRSKRRDVSEQTIWNDEG